MAGQAASQASPGVSAYDVLPLWIGAEISGQQVRASIVQVRVGSEAWNIGVPGHFQGYHSREDEHMVTQAGLTQGASAPTIHSLNAQGHALTGTAP